MPVPETDLSSASKRPPTADANKSDPAPEASSKVRAVSVPRATLATVSSGTLSNYSSEKHSGSPYAIEFVREVNSPGGSSAAILTVRLAGDYG
jgi:hypothetical protein